jgi:cyclopropane-fatty-acyl-phospholipid synthase
VSVEMIEAVGEKYLPGYFSKCSKLLKPNGMMLLQAITIPDHRYDRYRKSVDFIQQYIFPGGFLPSMGAIAQCVGRGTDLRFYHAEEFGEHYAKTLACWRENFWRNVHDIQSLGFDQQFIRTWHYYLCYCEAAFRERQTGVSQILLTKPDCRREPVLDISLQSIRVH